MIDPEEELKQYREARAQVFAAGNWKPSELYQAAYDLLAERDSLRKAFQNADADAKDFRAQRDSLREQFAKALDRKAQELEALNSVNAMRLGDALVHLEAANARIAALEDFIRQWEWDGEVDGKPCCIECAALKGALHRPGCELAMLLDLKIET